MATKLGEILVEAGVLTSAQLEDALESQVVFGGRLGTNLIEMGLLGENDLARYLSRKMGLPCVTSEQLMSVTPDIIRLLPRELAEKYHIIPLSLDKKRLTLAMLDPSDLSLMDEISFVTGYFIIPVIAPELRMVLALEMHYGIKPDMRFVQAAERIMERQSQDRQSRTGDLARQEPEPLSLPPRQEIDDVIDVSEEIITHAEPAGAEPATIEPATIEPIAVEPVAIKPIAVEPVTVEPVAVEPKMAENAAPAPPSPGEPGRITAEALAEGLAEAKDREEIADLLATCLARDFSRVALFMVKGTVAEGWRGIRNKEAITGIREIQISLEAPSVLKVVTDGKSLYLGTIPETPENSRMLAGMGGHAPSSALLLPLMLMGRVVAILYVEGGKTPLADRLADLQKLVGKAAMAFEILILKNKILMT
jgi:hypothetical protein